MGWPVPIQDARGRNRLRVDMRHPDADWLGDPDRPSESLKPGDRGCRQFQARSHQQDSVPGTDLAVSGHAGSKPAYGH